MALYSQGEPTSLMDGNKWIDNPQITIVECVGANSQDGKMRRITIKKTTLVVIVNLQILIYWLCPYRQKKSFR